MLLHCTQRHGQPGVRLERAAWRWRLRSMRLGPGTWPPGSGMPWLKHHWVAFAGCYALSATLGNNRACKERILSWGPSRVEELGRVDKLLSTLQGLPCDVRLTAGGGSACYMMPWSPHVPSPPRQDCGLGPHVPLLPQHGTVASVLTCPFSPNTGLWLILFYISCNKDSWLLRWFSNQYKLAVNTTGIYCQKVELGVGRRRLVTHRGGPIRHSEITDLML